MNKEVLAAPALEALLQAPSLAILAVDKQGCVILWSPSAARMFGWTESEVLGRFVPTVPEEHRQEVYDRIQSGLKGEIISALDVRRLRKDGSPVDVSLWTAPLRDSRGEVIGILGLYADITARKQAEEALQESEQRFRSVFSEAAVPTALGLPNGRYLQVNRAYCELLGYSEGELLATTFDAVTHPEDRATTARNSAQRLFAGELKTYQTEKRYLHKLGHVVWGALSVSVVRDTAGAPRYFIAQVQDITGRKRAEAALRESEQRFRALIEHSCDVISVLRADATIQFTSTSTSRVLGYQPHELVGRNALELIHPDDLPRITEVFNLLVQTPDGTAVEQCRCGHKDGSWRWIEISGTNCLAQPEVGGIVINFHDITLRKQAEEVLRESEERYRLMAEAIPQPVWRTNAQGETLECNGRWYEYTGQTPEEARGNGWMKALHPDDVHRVMQKVRDDVARGELYEAEYRVRRASDGSYRWHLARALPIKDKDGRVLCWFGGAVDIDDQKRAQEVLEERVRERTAELMKANEELPQSEAKYRTLVEQIPAITYIAALDEASTTLYVSPQVEPLLGLTLAEFQANAHTIWLEHLHPDDRERVMAELQHIRTSHEPFDCEYRMLNRTGGIVWFRDRAVVVRDEAGHPLFLQGVMLDVTERKELERAILEVSSREQARIGQDLHDSLCQRLTGIAFLWKVVADKVAARALPEASEVAEIGRLITMTIDEAHALAQGLCPVELENNDLGLALKELGSSVERLFAVSCTVRCQQAVRLADKTVALHLYRIAQEAVSNAIRHGKATHVWISFVLKKNKQTLWIRDNGVGFPGEQHCRRGTGIRGMRYRAQMIGATLTIERESGGGTRVTCVCNLGKIST
jgi:PAS domain S-box-containing protein